MTVTSTSFTSPRAGALKSIDSHSVFLIRTRAILRVGHTRVGAIAVVAATHGSFRMRRFKAALRSVHTRRRSRSSWRSGVSSYTAFRASTPCSIHFWASGILRSRLKIAASRSLLASRSTTHIWRRRREELGRRHPCLRGRRASRLPDDRQRPGETPGRPTAETAAPRLPVGGGYKFLERFDQIPRQWPDPIENALGNWFRR